MSFYSRREETGVLTQQEVIKIAQRFIQKM